MKKVVCINTGEIFHSIDEATKKYNIGIGLIGRNCKGQRKSAGKLNGNSLKWMFKEEYDKLSKEKQEQLKHQSTQKRIICLNTREEFYSNADAARKYNLPSDNISSCCNNKSYSAGELNGEPLVWMNIKDYKKLSEDEICAILKKRSTTKRKKVICINTGEIFDSVRDASRKYHSKNISACCLGKLNSAGELDGKKLHWMHYNEYIDLSEDERQDILKRFERRQRFGKKTTRVVCLNTKEIFDSIVKASSKYNITAGNITLCCRKRISTAGKINGEKAKWMYYDEYIKQNDIQ